MATSVVVFDVGNVLIEWDPEHLYRKLIPDAAMRADFLARVCSMEWNLEQDRGRRWADAVAERTALFPDQADLIAAYSDRWHDMVPGEVPGTVAILEGLREAGVPLYAITNFSSEKFAEARARFPFLAGFIDVVVSAEEGLLKPDPAIYRRLLDRNGLVAADCLFIDDSEKNVVGARAVGMRAHHFRDAEGLRAALRAEGLPA
ncbi:HAD family phosphatase [Roseomonas stagni]|uniref:HAD family phosphatase n=1 Tax=Falsiroseomonas algicola TaxID=2716930 RepID=A0A6M1LF28_9PROT|nr:HAD family phosphatase [Falsiroseomonas algicola]NGM18883.1 HAD family phosphatase [Falsiroseomonas algicola]